MNLLRSKIIRTIALLVVTVLLFTQSDIATTLLRTHTVYAVGDLIVDWGVLEGDPIFVVNNWAPGDTQTRQVQIKNTADSARPIGVRGVKTTSDLPFSDVIHFKIIQNSTTLYDNSLTEFFTESTGPEGIELITLQPNQERTFIFSAEFDEDAGNEYQNQSVIFDIHVGIAIAIPVACQHIDFGSRDPIFGTKKSEKISGTPQNDLIFALEGGDKVTGGTGDDCIVGGEGSDSLDGQGGNDVVLGEEGSDKLIGGNQNDTLLGGPGSDTMEGNGGNDTLTGEAGSDKAKGGSGTDTCSAESKISCEL